MQYFVTGIDGNEYGPVDLTTLKEWVADNRVQPSTKVRNATNGMVLQASTMPEVSGLFPAAPIPAPQAVAPMAGYHGQPTYMAPGMSMNPAAYQDNGWKPFLGVLALSLATAAVGVTIGFLSIILGSYSIQYAWKNNEQGEKGGVAGIIIAIVCAIVGIGWRYFIGPILRN